MRRKSIHRIISFVLFAAYLVFLGYLLFFSEDFGRIAEERSIQYNIVPFKEILRYIVRAKTIGAESVIINLGGNIAAFLPYGFFLPLLFSFFRGHPRRTVAAGAVTSAIIELIQLVSRVGCMDVDDVILNTAGAALGYALYVLVCYILRRKGSGSVTAEEKKIS